MRKRRDFHNFTSSKQSTGLLRNLHLTPDSHRQMHFISQTSPRFSISQKLSTHIHHLKPDVLRKRKEWHIYPLKRRALESTSYATPSLPSTPTSRKGALLPNLSRHLDHFTLPACPSQHFFPPPPSFLQGKKKLFPFRGSLLINGLGSLFALKGWHAGVHWDGLVNSGKTFSQAFFFARLRSKRMPNLFFSPYTTFFSCFVYPLFSPSGGLIKGPVAVAGLLMMQGGSLRSFSLIYFLLLILFTSVVFRNLLCRFRSAVSSSGLFDSVFLHVCPRVYVTKRLKFS